MRPGNIVVFTVAALWLGITQPVAAQTQPRQSRDTDRDQLRDQDRDPAPAGPAALTPEQARARDQMRDRIHAEAKLTQAEQAELGEPLDHYAAGGGTQAQLGPLVRTALDSGCKGTCLAEMVRQLNRSRHQGMDATTAGQTVTETLRAMKQAQAQSRAAASDADQAAQLRQRMTERLSAHARQQGGGAKDRQPARGSDRARERRMEHSPGRGGGMHHQGGGGPRGGGS
jgi:hypothetical protein